MWFFGHRMQARTHKPAQFRMIDNNMNTIRILKSYHCRLINTLTNTLFDLKLRIRFEMVVSLYSYTSPMTE